MDDQLPELELPYPAMLCDLDGGCFSAAQVRELVAAERERCAKLADDMDYGMGELAAAIRNP